jgi:hypothetical protein
MIHPLKEVYNGFYQEKTLKLCKKFKNMIIWMKDIMNIIKVDKNLLNIRKRRSQMNN